MILNEKFVLQNGVDIPKLGLGTWMIDDHKVAEVVIEAIKLGYRHIDTAQGYGNERGVGEGVRKCGVLREEIFVTTKLDANHKSYETAMRSIKKSLEFSGLEYFDLMLIHSPQPWTDYREGEHFFKENLEAWSALEEAYKAGNLKAIGVSNFEKEDLDNLMENAEIKPMINQVLAHIGNTPFELVEYCKRHDILVEAYSPVAHGEMMKNEEIKKMADKYKVSIPQLGIRYCLDMGMLPLPKTANPEHMKNNADLDFAILNEDMEILKHIKRIENYGDASVFPVFGGKLKKDGTLVAGLAHKQ